MNHKSKTILFLPFLQLSSGHHQVADSLIEEIRQNQPFTKCEKAEILSYSYGKIETVVSNTYLKWIQTFPKMYNWIYQHSVYKDMNQHKKYKLYEILFLTHIERLTREVQPDCIVCTHALPSYLLNILKEKNQLNVPVINIYTDFFIHSLWGIKHTDLHLVPSLDMKLFLQKKGIKEKQILVTGIPVHRAIQKQEQQIRKPNLSSLSLLITGGSLGMGEIEALLASIEPKGKITYYVLCGKNAALYQKIKKQQNRQIIPLSYIESRTEMNRLYDQVDGILTKPGGVTISESLMKRKPIFIYDALPGQEIINLRQLQKLGVVFYLHHRQNTSKTLEKQLYSFFKDSEHSENAQKSIAAYHDQLVDLDFTLFVNQLIQDN